MENRRAQLELISQSNLSEREKLLCKLAVYNGHTIIGKNSFYKLYSLRYGFAFSSVSFSIGEKLDIYIL